MWNGVKNKYDIYKVDKLSHQRQHLITKKIIGNYQNENVLINRVDVWVYVVVVVGAWWMNKAWICNFFFFLLLMSFLPFWGKSLRDKRNVIICLVLWFSPCKWNKHRNKYYHNPSIYAWLLSLINAEKSGKPWADLSYCLYQLYLVPLLFLLLNKKDFEHLR